MEPGVQRSVPDLSRGLADFWRSVAETVCWCLPRATLSQPGTELRHPHFQPSLMARDRFATMERVLYGRQGKVRRSDVDALLATGDVLSGGRLLVFTPDESLSDGAAAVETRGFFDDDNVPAWDTWVGMFGDAVSPGSDLEREYLVAWVPPVLLDAVAQGLWVNPEQCILWLDDSDTALARLLRGGG